MMERISELFVAVIRREKLSFRIACEILGSHPGPVNRLEQADQRLCRLSVIFFRIVAVAPAAAAALHLDELEEEDAEEAEDEAGDDENAARSLGALLLDDLKEDDVDEGAGGQTLGQYSVLSRDFSLAFNVGT